MIHFRYIPALGLLACAPEPKVAGAPVVHFLRGAVQEGDGPVQPMAWRPGEVVLGAVAPRSPECREMLHVELGDRRSDAEQGVPPAGVALAFSPDGARLAVGTASGRVQIVAVPGGEVLVTARSHSGPNALLYFGGNAEDVSTS